jgi:drug/metabolite transporter (DMT)-like permease
MIYQFLLGALAHFTAAYVSYSDYWKTSKYYYLVGLVATFASSAIWMTIAKQDNNSSTLVIKALYWDCMLMLIYLAVPFVLFNATITMYQAIGITLVTIGLILTKV